MKIHVRFDPSEDVRYESFDLYDDLGVTEEEWNSMDEEERELLLMDAVEDNEPYWMVYRYDEEQDETE